MNTPTPLRLNKSLIRDGIILSLGLLVTLAGFLGPEISLTLAGA